jgi:hypothetical protein
MTFNLSLSRFNINGVETKGVSHTQRRVHKLHFRVPKRLQATLDDIRSELSAYVQQANDRRLETEPAWHLDCFRKGRNFVAVCTQHVN